MSPETPARPATCILVVVPSPAYIHPASQLFPAARGYRVVAAGGDVGDCGIISRIHYLPGWDDHIGTDAAARWRRYVLGAQAVEYAACCLEEVL